MYTALFVAALASVVLSQDPAAEPLDRKAPLAARFILKNIP